MVIFTIDFAYVFQFETPGFYLRVGREFANCAAAHDTESGFPGDFVHAAALIEGTFDFGGARLISQLDQVLGNLSLGQQRFAFETGKFIQFANPLRLTKFVNSIEIYLFVDKVID